MVLIDDLLDIFGEFVDNFVKGFRGFTQLIYLDGYGLTDLGYILLIFWGGIGGITVIGLAFYFIKEIMKWRFIYKYTVILV